MTCDMYLVTCDTWREVDILLKVQALALTVKE